MEDLHTTLTTYTSKSEEKSSEFMNDYRSDVMENCGRKTCGGKESNLMKSIVSTQIME